MQLEETYNPRIVILCGGPFSYRAISTLAYEKYLVGIAIATQEPTVARSLQVECEQSGIPFMFVPHKKQVHLLGEWLEQIRPDAVFSICFPYLIPENILSVKACKFINFHTGPLPAYRGPMPIFEVLRRQEPYTAVTAHMMDHTYDTGAVIYAEEVEVTHGETFTSLAQKLSERSALMALNIAEMCNYGNTFITTPQPKENDSFYPFPAMEELYIDWQQMSAREIIALIRAGNGWNNGAITSFGDSEIHLISVHPDPIPMDIPTTPGTILHLSENGSGEIACIRNEKILVHQFGTENGVYSYPFLLQMGLQTKKNFVNKINDITFT